MSAPAINESVQTRDSLGNSPLDFGNERQLWAAVLCISIADIGQLAPGSAAEKIRHQKDARIWMNSKAETRGSFLWICNTLDIDPTSLRNAALSRAHTLAFADLSSFSVSGDKVIPHANRR